MSSEFNSQYDRPQGGSPAQIVWHSDAPAPSAWAGPGAFSAEPVSPEAGNPESAPAAGGASLSSAWASYSSQSAGSPQAASETGRPNEPEPQSGGASAVRRPADWQQPAPPPPAQDPWVQSGSADTANEVHQEWTDRRHDAPSAPQPYEAGSAAPAEPDVNRSPAAPQNQSPGAYDPYARPREDTLSPQQDPHETWSPQAEQWAPASSGSQGAQDAWSAHHSQPTEQPMATDPEQGDAIPAPPATAHADQQPSQPSNASGDVPDDALSIGRGRENSIVLDDMLVSRKHIRITADDHGLLLEDLGSRNGTYVNGQRVDRAHLEEGDRIGVGATTFEVRDGWLVTI